MTATATRKKRPLTGKQAAAILRKAGACEAGEYFVRKHRTFMHAWGASTCVGDLAWATRHFSTPATVRAGWVSMLRRFQCSLERRSYLMFDSLIRACIRSLEAPTDSESYKARQEARQLLAFHDGTAYVSERDSSTRTILRNAVRMLSDIYQGHTSTIYDLCHWIAVDGDEARAKLFREHFPMPNLRRKPNRR